jgi:hypothetical protein
MRQRLSVLSAEGFELRAGAVMSGCDMNSGLAAPAAIGSSMGWRRSRRPITEISPWRRSATLSNLTGTPLRAVGSISISRISSVRLSIPTVRGRISGRIGWSAETGPSKRA